MSVRPGQHAGRVVQREQLSAHLVRLVIGELGGFTTTGVPDEWVALTVPGQFQTRYYTVRTFDPATSTMVLDVVVHEHGLVTDWAAGDCVGDEVGISSAKGSFALPEDAGWVVLAGDLTGLPAMARIGETLANLAPTVPVTAYVESPEPADALPDYLPGTMQALWSSPPDVEQSGLADLVAGLTWPEGPGYFWMAGESAQMRRIRTHARRELGWSGDRLDVMGYWSATRGRQRRAVDPGPIYARGKALGKSDEEIWAEYDEARDEARDDKDTR
ncbi:siderophore-interacting protein [Nocardioidaceae bacterium]|nr:siderophore-interacting protein [Nocardioidaceae bacterium]